MTPHNEITQLLISARREKSLNRSKQLLNLAVKKCNDLESSGPAIRTSVLKARILKDLALEETLPAKRSALWKESVTVLDKAWKRTEEYRAVEAQVAIAVDCFQDSFNDLDLQPKLVILRDAQRNVEEALRICRDKRIKALLLSRKSSLLRHLARGDLGQYQLNKLIESTACAELAMKLRRSSTTLIENGLSQWAFSYHEKTDEKIVMRLKTAEECLTDHRLKNNEAGQLTLARFYRMTYRKLDACKSFPRLTAEIKNVRSLLRESFVLAEAAFQLWLSDYPRDLALEYCKEARGVLELALAYGYDNARTIIDLAYLIAILEGPEQGSITLGDIQTAGRTISWEKALQIVSGDDLSSPLVHGFALGINQSNVWNSLGTYATIFLRDAGLAEVFYRTAKRLDETNVIALTNLARLLVRRAGNDDLREAERLLQKAQSLADKRFTWWRIVLEELTTAKNQPPKPQKSLDHLPASSSNLVNMKQVRDRLKRAELLTDAKERGYELEGLVHEVARLSFGIADPSYRNKRDSGARPQIDGFFRHENQGYRYECKWETKPISTDKIYQFAQKLDVSGISGLFVSMSGFRRPTIGEAKRLSSEHPILLMDGSEVRLLFSGQISFDNLMSQKRAHFEKRSEPYHVVVPDKGTN